MWYTKDEHKQCEACISRDYHINSLQTVISEKNREIGQLTTHLFELEKQLVEIIQYKSGIRGYEPQPTHEFKAMPRNSGIFARIRKAEQTEANPTLSAQRHREYEERIAQILNPEIEVRNDAS